MFSHYRNKVDDLARTTARRHETSDKSEFYSDTKIHEIKYDLMQSREANDIFQKLRTELHHLLLETLNLSAIDDSTSDELRSEIQNRISDYLSSHNIDLAEPKRQILVGDLLDDIIGLGPLESLMRDDAVSDILVNGPDQVFVERGGKLFRTQATFRDDRHLLRIIDKMASAVGRRIDESSPCVDARLKDGSRINAVIHPIALDGPFISIRKRRSEMLHIGDLIRLGAFDERISTYLEGSVRSRQNIIISGGAGSGKTTLLNSLSSFIDDAERVITIEDTAELQLQKVHVVRLESRPANIEGRGEITQRNCLSNALRMRPDRIIVGETRGDEVIDMLQAMNTGHHGSMTTIHANSARDATYRIENMYLMAGIDLPIKALRAQISSAINIIIQTARMPNGIRLISEIQEITGMEGDTISMQEIFALKDEIRKLHLSTTSALRG